MLLANAAPRKEDPLSTPLDLRVADALHLIADHVLKHGMDHPEGLSVSIPYIENNVEVGELQVVAHVNLDEHSVGIVPATETLDLSRPQTIDPQANKLFDFLSSIGKQGSDV